VGPPCFAGVFAVVTCAADAVWTRPATWLLVWFHSRREGNGGPELTQRPSTPQTLFLSGICWADFPTRRANVTIVIRLYDTARQAVFPLEQREPGKLSLYVCGPTVYAPPHIGHGRQTIVYDLLRRFCEWSGIEVNHTSNITDIDDNIIKRGLAESRDPAQIAIKCENIWWMAMDKLNVLRPHHAPRATQYVDQMVELIENLIELDKAYVTTDGVYLSVETVPGYGLLANQSLDDLIEGGGERTIVGVEKRHSADFVLWKFSKEGEPFWPSPWGDGRPGWHTECVVMSLDILGEGFDLHSGGLDLTFPHHENERAQALAIGSTFANHWMHHGFVEMGGEKMSKSLGNTMNLLDVMETYDGRAFRLIMLQSHYRSPVEVTETTMRNGMAALERLDTFARRTSGLEGAGDPATLAKFKEAMENDLDTPAGVDLMFRLVREANTALDQNDTSAAATAAATALEIASVFGLELSSKSQDLPAEIQALLDERAEVRKSKDFARSDEIRDQLAADGWTVTDGADGQSAHHS
jgi:cysteinyl-tRNA synthetase